MDPLLEELVLGCLAKDPDRRPTDVELIQSLGTLRDRHPYEPSGEGPTSGP